MIKQMLNSNDQNPKQFDLEERTFNFAKRCRDFISKLSKTITNRVYGGQLARSSGSVAANYIEANESISRKDFFHRIKISRKESKESRLWLRLCDVSEKSELIKEQYSLVSESIEFVKIFTSIIKKS